MASILHIPLCDINFGARDAEKLAKNHKFPEFIVAKRVEISEWDQRYMVQFLFKFYSHFFQIFVITLTIFN